MKKTACAASLLLCVILCFALLPATAFAVDPVIINETVFPDPVFRFYIEETLDTDTDGMLSVEEITAVTAMDLKNEGTMENLDGIEIFTRLKTLRCSGCGLKKLNISANKALTTLDCSYNNLTELDLRANTKLKTVNCSNNLLSTLAVGSNANLRTLDCSYNGLTALDVTGCPALKDIHCNVNAITALNVANNTNLTTLVCVQNQLTSLNVASNTALTELSCSENLLTKLNVTKNPELKILGCSQNQLTKLNVTQNVKLRQLVCIDNRLTSLNVAYNTELRVLCCSNNQLTSLNVTQNTALKDLCCEGNAIGTVDIRTVPGLLKAYNQGTKTTPEGACQYELYTETSGGPVIYRLAVPAAAKVRSLSVPKITTQPASKTVTAGAKVTFKVKASGGVLKYQWYYQKPGTSKWVKITKNAAAAAYSLTAKKSLNGYKYMCRVSNTAGYVKTEPAKLKVK